MPVVRDTVAAGDLPQPGDAGAFRDHPLAAWVESRLGVTTDSDGVLIRSQPMPIAPPGGLAPILARETGLAEEACLGALRATLLAGFANREADGRPLLLRLRGSSVHATPE